MPIPEKVEVDLIQYRELIDLCNLLESAYDQFRVDLLRVALNKGKNLAARVREYELMQKKGVYNGFSK